MCGLPLPVTARFVDFLRLCSHPQMRAAYTAQYMSPIGFHEIYFCAALELREVNSCLPFRYGLDESGGGEGKPVRGPTYGRTPATSCSIVGADVSHCDDDMDDTCRANGECAAAAASTSISIL